MAINDFKYIIIGGSTKCGTTSLFEYLAWHPMVNRSVQKESRFFWTDEYKINDVSVSWKNGIESYNDVFTKDKNSNLRLEATPDYLYSEQTVQLIKNYLHDCKIIFLLRDPVDRIISWYKFAKQLNLIGDIEIDEYVKTQLHSDAKSNPQHLRAVEQSCYGRYLKSWYELFGNQNIFVGFYSDLSENPLNLMKQICDFTGLDSTFYNQYDFKIFNKSINIKDAESFNKYRNFRRNLRRKLKAIPFGNFIKNLLNPINKMYIKQAGNSNWEDIKLDADLIKSLNEYYAADKLLLEQLIQKKAPW